MRGMQLYAKGARYRYKHYGKKHNNPERPNILEQVFEAGAPNKIWLGDITYIRTKKGFIYLAAFLDVYSRKIVGWHIADRMKDSLVLEAFKQAWGREQPEPDLIVHTDQGSQFTGSNFRLLLHKHKAVPSNSRKGNPYDNALMESFFRTLKRELVNGAKFESKEHACTEIFKYIELYYNRKRMHSALGYLAPVQFEKLQAELT